jgi:hypothetical protein
MVYMYQRWYQPETGTFASRAPFTAWVENPWGFAENDPIALGDVEGEFPGLLIPVFAGGGGGAAVGGGAAAGAGAGAGAAVGGFAAGAGPAAGIVGAGMAGYCIGTVISPWLTYTGEFYGELIADGLHHAKHRKNARPSTKGKHQKGTKRVKTDRGREKGDGKRDVNRKRPGTKKRPHKGPWPPK